MTTSVTPARLRLSVTFGILALALLLRLPLALDPGLTGDEVSNLLLARCAPRAQLDGTALDPSNPPLDPLVLHAVRAVGGERLWLLKLVGVAANLATIALLMALAQRWAGATAALLTGLLVAVNPWHVYLATELRGYALLGFWAAAAFLCADRFARDGRRTAALAWALAIAAACWTHYSGVVLGLATGVYGLHAAWRRQRDAKIPAANKPGAHTGRDARTRPGRDVAVWLGCAALAIALAALWLPQMAKQDIQAGGRPEAWWHLFGTPAVQAVGTMLLRPEVGKRWLALGTAATLLIFGVPFAAGAWRLARTRRDALLLIAGLLGLAVCVPLARSAAIGSLSFSTRYTFIASGGVLILLATGLAALPSRVRWVAAIGVLALSTVALAQMYRTRAGRDFGAEPFARAAAEVPDGDAFLFPQLSRAFHARYFQPRRWPRAYVEGGSAERAGFVPSDATFENYTLAMRDPAGYYTGAWAASLRRHRAVWYWQEGTGDEPPALLGRAYRPDRAVMLVAPGSFGHETQIRLVRWVRDAAPAGATSSSLPGAP